jgi:HD-like signal output (HDOD) protein
MHAASLEMICTQQDLRALDREDRYADLRGIVANFTPISPVFSEMLTALSGGVLGWKQVADLVRRDAALAARTLTVANAAANRGEGAVDSIEAASRRLGTAGLNQVVLASAMAFVAKHDNLGYAIEGPSMWRWCLGMAYAAERLSAQVPGLAPEIAYTGGLVADIGKIALGRLPDSRSLHHRVQDFAEAERAVFGVDHATVSAWMLHRWGLPFELVSGVRWHHQPDEHPTDLADVLHAASHVAAATCGVGVDALQYPISERVQERLLGGDAFELTMLAVTDALRRFPTPEA